MKFTIITHVPHISQNGKYYAYAPYVREMNLWSKHVDKLILVAHQKNGSPSAIEETYDHTDVDFRTIGSFDILSLKGILGSLMVLPGICWQIFRAMKQADHIHLRCPGNIGLLGCIVQILFPSKPKTAKYAGNWDPNSKQPWSYRLQKSILNNTFLTRNMQVLVYGQWPDRSKNIKPFFTATYSETDKTAVPPRNLNGQIRFLFVGTLSPGKRPLYAVRLVDQLKKLGHDVRLDMYGEGMVREELESYIGQNNLSEQISLKGNRSADEVREACQQSHFLILPSKSEGWPKAVAEAMFWGCVPLATPVSCVPWMLDYGNRGNLLTLDLNPDVESLVTLLKDQSAYNSMSESALKWSQQYTVDYFEKEVKSLLTREGEKAFVLD